MLNVGVEKCQNINQSAFNCETIHGSGSGTVSTQLLLFLEHKNHKKFLKTITKQRNGKIEHKLTFQIKML